MSGQFQRRLGLFDATMLVAGSMIGSGIFIVSADIVRDVGGAGWLLVIWLLAGLLTVIGALSYAELAALMPHAGGQYIYLRDAYHPLCGFLYGWTCFLVIQTGFIAAVAVAFAKYLGVLVPGLGTDAVLWQSGPLGIHLRLSLPWMEEPMTFFRRDDFKVSAGQFVALVVVIFLTALNMLGVQQGKFVQNVFTVAKTLALGLLIVAGLTFAADAEAMRRNLLDPWGGIHHTQAMAQTQKIVPWTTLAIFMVLSGAMVGALFSSDAWNNVTFIAGEIREPERNLPRSLILGTGGVIVLYLLANLAYLSALPVEGVKGGATAFERGIAHASEDRVATAVLEQVSPGWGVTFMSVAIMISTFGCANGILLMGARLFYAMAQDRLFFRAVGKLNRRGVPAAGLVYQAIWAALLIFSGSYSELLDYVIFAALLFYMLTIGSVFIFRRTLADRPRPYRAWGYPVAPLLYLVLCGIIMVSLLIVKPVYSWPSFLIVVSGIPVYYIWRRGSRAEGVQ